MSAGRTVNSKSQTWGTPIKYVNAVKKFFNGEIDLDPCSNDYSIVNAKVEYKLPENDGLNSTWNYNRIYVNPPYGSDRERGTSIKNWLERCFYAYDKYGSEVVALVPVATNTSHWKKYVFGKANSICFLYDTRLKFLEAGKDTGKGAPMSCCFVYWGNNSENFFQHFIHFGAVVNIEDLKGIPIGEEKNKILIPFEG